MNNAIGVYNLPLAVCSFYLKDGEWMPLGIASTITAKHRSAEGGPIITARVAAAIDGSSIAAWSKVSYLRRSVGPDGTIEPIDLTYVGEVLDAGAYDAEVRQAGAIGICERLLAREPDPQGWTPTPELQEELFHLARTLIGQKVRGLHVRGVRLCS